MQSPHGLDTPRNVAKSVGAIVALAVLVGLGILLIQSHRASLLIGYTLIVAFLLAVGWAAIKERHNR